MVLEFTHWFKSYTKMYLGTFLIFMLLITLEYIGTQKCTYWGFVNFFFANKFSSIHKTVRPEHKYNDMHL